MHTAFTASKHKINLSLWGKGTAFAPDSHRIHGLSQEHLSRLNFGKKKKQKTISSNLKEGTKNAHPHYATSPGLTTVILEQADPC